MDLMTATGNILRAHLTVILNCLYYYIIIDGRKIGFTFVVIFSRQCIYVYYYQYCRTYTSNVMTGIILYIS